MRDVESIRGDSQVMQIYSHLKTHGSITTIEAFKRYSVTRLSAHIYVLIHDYGVPVRGEMIETTTGNVKRRCKRYYLENKDD